MNIRLITRKILHTLLLLAIAPALYCAPQKQIAITIDDLPFVGEYRNLHLNMIVKTLTEQQVPATGFIIAREVRKDNWEALQAFRDAGLGLGNHTYSHANLNKVKASEFINEIRKADKILSPVLTKPKYFRYPYLAVGTGHKRNKILCYLAKKHYKVAPITIDSKDFAFNQRLLSVPEADRRAYLEELKPFYLEFIWQQTLYAQKNTLSHPNQAQILLIHANLLNAYSLTEIINLYKQNGYTFISLQDALKTIKDTNQCATHLAYFSKNLAIEDFIEWD